MLASLTFLSALLTSPATILVSGPAPTDAQTNAITRAASLTDAELEELKLFRFNSDDATVLVTSDAFPFREYDALNNSLAALSRQTAKMGLIVFPRESGGVLTAMIRVGAQKQLAIMPRVRLVIQVDNLRKVVGTERADIHLSYPVASGSGERSSTPPDPWPRLPIGVASRLQLRFSADASINVTEAKGYAIAMRILDEEVSKCVSSFANAYHALFISARDSDPEHFGKHDMEQGGMAALSDSMIDVIAMQIESDPAFKGMDRAAVRAKVREGKIVRVVRGIFVVNQTIGASGGRSATLRELPIPEPPRTGS